MSCPHSNKPEASPETCSICIRPICERAKPRTIGEIIVVDLRIADDDDGGDGQPTPPKKKKPTKKQRSEQARAGAAARWKRARETAQA